MDLNSVVGFSDVIVEAELSVLSEVSWEWLGESVNPSSSEVSDEGASVSSGIDSNVGSRVGPWTNGVLEVKSKSETCRSNFNWGSNSSVNTNVAWEFSLGTIES